MVNSKRLRIFGHSAVAVMLTAGILTAPAGAHAAGGDDDDAPMSEYSLARKALDDGDYDVAINKLARLRDQDPGDADVLNLLGYGYRKIGDFDQARGYYLQALAADPKHRGANEYIGELYLKPGNWIRPKNDWPYWTRTAGSDARSTPSSRSRLRSTKPITVFSNRSLYNAMSTTVACASSPLPTSTAG